MFTLAIKVVAFPGFMRRSRVGGVIGHGVSICEPHQLDNAKFEK